MGTRLPIQVLVYLHSGSEEDLRYLLLRRRPESYGIWQGVTGGVEQGETPEAAARREVLEETGFGLGATEIRPYGRPHSFDPGQPFRKRHPGLHEVTEHLFHAEVSLRDPVLSEREHDEFRWCRLEDAMELLHWPANLKALCELDGILRGRD